jgi:hypothetical protein
MLRRIRCRECGNRFYTATDDTARECQECTDSYDRSAQAKKDAEAILKANSRHVPDEPQTVNPRNPAPSKRKAKEASE